MNSPSGDSMGDPALQDGYPRHESAEQQVRPPEQGSHDRKRCAFSKKLRLL